MRTKIVAGNWKMHKNAEETEDLLNELIDKLPTDKEVQIIVAPTFVNLSSSVNHLEFTNIGVAAQNMHQAESGAYTGEISADMLQSIGVNTVILGHSERRAYFHETDALIASKVDTAIKQGEKVFDKSVDALTTTGANLVKEIPGVGIGSLPNDLPWDDEAPKAPKAKDDVASAFDDLFNN